MSQTQAAGQWVNPEVRDEIIARSMAQSIAKHGDDSGFKLKILAEVANMEFDPASENRTAHPSRPGPAPAVVSPDPVALPPPTASGGPARRRGELSPHHQSVRQIEREASERVKRLKLRAASRHQQSPAFGEERPVGFHPLRPAPTRAPASAPNPESPPPAPAPAGARAAAPSPESRPASPAPQPGVRLRTTQAHQKADEIEGYGATDHRDGRCIKCVRANKDDCKINPRIADGNTCARCARNKEKCSHQQVADGRFIRANGHPARDGPCRQCQAKIDNGQPAECYQVDPTEKGYARYGTGCSQCCIDGTRESCSHNLNPRKRKSKFRE